jgi:hypothetical protein
MFVGVRCSLPSQDVAIETAVTADGHVEDDSNFNGRTRNARLFVAIPHRDSILLLLSDLSARKEHVDANVKMWRLPVP